MDIFVYENVQIQLCPDRQVSKVLTIAQICFSLLVFFSKNHVRSNLLIFLDFYYNSVRNPETYEIISMTVYCILVLMSVADLMVGSILIPSNEEELLRNRETNRRKIY